MEHAKFYLLPSGVLPITLERRLKKYVPRVDLITPIEIIHHRNQCILVMEIVLLLLEKTRVR